MAHQDARCASAAETIVVAAGGSLPTVTSLSGKKLVVVRGTVSGSLAWTLASLPQMTIVGQTTGTLSGVGSTATVHVTGGDLYIRNLTSLVARLGSGPMEEGCSPRPCQRQQQYRWRHPARRGRVRHQEHHCRQQWCKYCGDCRFRRNTRPELSHHAQSPGTVHDRWQSTPRRHV